MPTKLKKGIALTGRALIAIALEESKSILCLTSDMQTYLPLDLMGNRWNNQRFKICLDKPLFEDNIYVKIV